MISTHIFLVALLAVPTLQDETCFNLASNCEEMKDWCEISSFVKNKQCRLSCGVCTPTGCEPECVNGACTGLNTCTCEPGWVGAQCESATCEPQCPMGTCTKPDTCAYRPGLDKFPCANDAKNVTDTFCSTLKQDSCKYQTIRDKCKSLCSSESCASNCKNGDCSSDFTCECYAGFQGPTCDDAVTSVGKYDCPHPWTLVNNNYTNQCIFYVKDKILWGHSTKSWEGARKICQDMGSDLPRFNTMDDMKGIAHGIRQGSFQALLAWVRAYRTPEGRNYWADDNTEVSADLLSPMFATDKYDKRRPYATTIDKECLVFRPASKNTPWHRDNGIYNDGNVPCDKNMGGKPKIDLICQKWIAYPSPYHDQEECIWRGREIQNVKDCKLVKN